MNTEQSYVGKGCHANPAQESVQNEPTTQPSPKRGLVVSLPLSVNSLGGRLNPDARIVYNALRHYRQRQLKFLLNQHVAARQEGHGYDDAAGVWEEIEQIETLQEELTYLLIKLAEQNYWKADQLENPDQYERTTQHFAEHEERLVKKYVEEFKIAIP